MKEKTIFTEYDPLLGVVLYEVSLLVLRVSLLCFTSGITILWPRLTKIMGRVLFLFRQETIVVAIGILLVSVAIRWSSFQKDGSHKPVFKGRSSGKCTYIDMPNYNVLRSLSTLAFWPPILCRALDSRHGNMFVLV